MPGAGNTGRRASSRRSPPCLPASPRALAGLAWSPEPGSGSRRAAVSGKIRCHDLEVTFELFATRAQEAPVWVNPWTRTILGPWPCLVACSSGGRRPAACGSRRTSPVTVAAGFSATLVDEWVRAGLTDAVVAPGSRSTPLVVALARESRIALHVRLDERSAAFFAVGIGLATGRPAVLVTTSGTAAVGVHAAVVEAHLSRVPLIVCTADRPPELHHVGAPQTIEQAGLFAGALRWAVDPACQTSGPARAGARSAAASSPRRRPVPWGPDRCTRTSRFETRCWRTPVSCPRAAATAGRGTGSSTVRRVLDPGSLDAFVALARPAARGLIVAGAGAGRPEAIRRLAVTLGWPVLADPRSGARTPGEPGSPTVAAADALLRVESFASAHVPEIVLRLGQPWASKVMGELADVLRRVRRRPGTGRPLLGLAGPPSRGRRRACRLIRITSWRS